MPQCATTVSQHCHPCLPATIPLVPLLDFKIPSEDQRCIMLHLLGPPNLLRLSKRPLNIISGFLLKTRILKGSPAVSQDSREAEDIAQSTRETNE